MKINIGPDIFKIPGMVNIDIRPEVHPDLVMNIKNLGIKNLSVAEIHMGNILEHLFPIDLIAALAECHRILAPNGQMCITIPLVDLALQSRLEKKISEETYTHILKGDGTPFGSHKIQFQMGDIERYLWQNGFKCEVLDLRTYPFLVVSNTSNPVPDPWQYGVKAFKI